MTWDGTLALKSIQMLLDKELHAKFHAGVDVLLLKGMCTTNLERYSFVISDLATYLGIPWTTSDPSFPTVTEVIPKLVDDLGLPRNITADHHPLSIKRSC
jgi:hypothetical protein